MKAIFIVPLSKKNWRSHTNTKWDNILTFEHLNDNWEAYGKVIKACME
jgi:hypothetical protein